MLAAAQTALAVVAVTMLLAQAPAKPAPQQRDADREQARQLLDRAAVLISEVENNDNRITLLLHLARTHAQAGDSDAASAVLTTAFDEVQKLKKGESKWEVSHRSGLTEAYARAGNLAAAQRVIDTAPESKREHLIAVLVSSYSRSSTFLLADFISMALRISDTDTRESVLLHHLQARVSRLSTEEAQLLLTLLRDPANRAIAEAHIGAAKVRRNDPSGAREVADATRSALAAGNDPRLGVSGVHTKCATPESTTESAKDVALREVAETRLNTGEAAGALIIVDEIQYLAGREDLLVRIADHYAAKGDSATAHGIALRITRPECRDVAVESLAEALHRGGHVNAAVQFASSLSTPYARAQALNRVAVREFAEERLASALRIATLGFQFALNVEPNEERWHTSIPLSALQADSGAPATARQNMRELTNDVVRLASPSPHGFAQSALRRLSVCQAGLGEASFAIEAMRASQMVGMLDVLRHMASHQTRVGDLTGALQWIEALPTPQERSFGLIGAAAGLLSPPSSHRNC